MDSVKALFMDAKGYSFTPEQSAEFIALKDTAKGRIEFVGDSPAPASTPDADTPATKPQITALQTHYSGMPREERLAAVSGLLGHAVGSFKELSKADAHLLMETFKEEVAA